MPLADDIRLLCDRVLADLNAAHDYFSDTKFAWQIVRKAVASDDIKKSVKKSTITGTVTTQAELVAKARGYMAVQVPEGTFQQFVSIFEVYFFEIMRLWLLSHPESLSAKTVEFKTVMELSDKDAIALFLANRELNEVAYGRPAEWFKYMERTWKLGLPNETDIERFTEAKASRDVLVHNQGIANSLYESKAGNLARHASGERIEIPADYHRETWELIRKMVTDISGAAIAKAL